MNLPLRLGIVGCGSVTREYHLPVLTKVPDLHIAVLCDNQVSAARLIQTEFRLAETIVTTTVNTLHGNVDAALVAVPPRLHAPVAIGLLNAGIDVLCEKPLATGLLEAQQMIATAQTNHRILAAGLQMRFHPNNDLLRNVVTDGWLGNIQEVVAEFGAINDWHMTGPSYYSRAQTGGGVFFDMGVHLVDRIVWLFGGLSDLEYADDSYGGVESNAILTGKLQIQNQQVPCRMVFSWTHALRNSLRLIGTEATAEVNLRDGKSVFIHKLLAGNPSVMQLRSANSTHGSDNPYQVQAEDFLQAVRTRCAPFVAAATTTPALEIIERAYTIRRHLSQPWVEA